jgi:hypothetical protein
VSRLCGAAAEAPALQTFFSFEFFPPKTDDGVENLWERMDTMVAHQVRALPARRGAACARGAGCGPQLCVLRQCSPPPRRRAAASRAPPAGASRGGLPRAAALPLRRHACCAAGLTLAAAPFLRAPPQPMFCDITWGAGGSTADLTLDIATNMQNMVRARLRSPRATHAAVTPQRARAEPGWRLADLRGDNDAPHMHQHAPGVPQVRPGQGTHPAMRSR